MQKLHQSILHNIAKFFPFHDLFKSFEPLCKSTNEIVTDICREKKYLILDNYSQMTDSQFILLVRRCCAIEYLSIDYSSNMIQSNQDLWEVNIYCPKLKYIIIHGSPIHAHELGEEFVENLAGYNGSIQNIYVDNMNIHVYHVFAAARIIFLVNKLGWNESLLKGIWCLIKYVLANKDIQMLMPYLCLDQLIVCAVYAICRIFGKNITFQSILDLYVGYFASFQNSEYLIQWCDIQKIWFNIDLSKLINKPLNNGTMVDLYNYFFVPLVYKPIQELQQIILTNQMKNPSCY